VRIDALLGGRPTRSFEFFPPKDADEARRLERTLTRLAALNPDFVSVTYRGGPASRTRTAELVHRIEREYHLVAMAHLVCAGHTGAELREILADYVADGVENLMALGGDPPEDPAAPDGEFHHAIDLVSLARECGPFSIGVAAQPSGHLHSPSLAADRRFLASKMAIADFAVTQFFFEAAQWSSLVEDLAALGVTKPVVPGIIPVSSLSSVPRMAQMGGPVPPPLLDRLTRASERGGPAAVREEGLAAAVELCTALLAAGAPGIHFYTMNRAALTEEIVAAVPW
jgi:methylenetetrahydrofolate reductase (NADPH)